MTSERQIASNRRNAKFAGRPKGAMNKLQKAAKEAIEEAAEQLGGVNRLVEWAREDPLNERLFWGSVYPKLLPLTAHLSGQFNVTWPLAKTKLDE